MNFFFFSLFSQEDDEPFKKEEEEVYVKLIEKSWKFIYQGDRRENFVKGQTENSIRSF